MLTIWGRANSSNVQKVLWCCGELALSFERIDAGGSFGRTDGPEYRGLNPTGLVPTIVDGSYVLWESNVVVRYLATKQKAEAIFPSALKRRFDVERWMDWASTGLWPAVRPVFLGMIRTPPEKRDAAAMAQSHAIAERAFAVLDGELSRRRFIAGDGFTVADIPLAITAHRWLSLDMDGVPRRLVERWYKSMKERPAFCEHVDHPLS
jgi:glutathione S-transferase